MPKFDVIITRTVTETMSYEVSAKDEESADKKAHDMIRKCEYSRELIEEETKEAFDIDGEDYDIEIQEA